MAYDSATQMLYLSAYDRRTHSKGGIYRLPIEDVKASDNIRVTPVIDNIRPHGIDLTRRDTRLILDFIDRQGTQDNKMPVIRSLSWMDAEPKILKEDRPISDARLCASNDLVRTYELDADDERIFITQDHKSCTRGAQNRENIFSPNQASVGWINSESPSPTNILTSLSFANGIAFSKNLDVIYVAETRKNRLVVHHPHYFNTTPIKLSDAPDNLTRNGEDIYAALIPSLIKFSRFQKNPKKRIRSRFVIITPVFPDSEERKEQPATFTTATYDVPASVISGATVAIKAGEHIWLGAAYDTAIARCAQPKPI